MRFSAALVAGFAAATSAFLVPLEVANDAVGDDLFKDTQHKHENKPSKDPITALLTETTQRVKLDCPKCPYALDSHGSIVYGRNVEGWINLEFSTHDQGFQVNGQPILPFTEIAAKGAPVITATVTPKDYNKESIPMTLSFAVEKFPVILNQAGKDGVLELTPVHFTILSLNRTPVKVDTIVLDLVKMPEESTYSVARITKVPFKNTPGAKTCSTDSRRWGLCRVKAMIVAQLKAMMEAAKHGANKAHGWVTGNKKPGCAGRFRHGANGGKSHQHGQPDHNAHRQHHHHHHRVHRLGRVLRKVLHYFIIPALLGVIGGLTASALGMFVGQLIVFLWHRLYRRGERGALRVVEQEVIIVEDEKDGLLTAVEVDEESLPQYEDNVEAQHDVDNNDEKK